MWVSNLEEEEEDLSLILTSQNPARIDVRTLRKKKVIIIPTNALALAVWKQKYVHMIEIIFFL